MDLNKDASKELDEDKYTERKPCYRVFFAAGLQVVELSRRKMKDGEELDMENRMMQIMVRV